ncbi:FAD:protein FMN transferase [Maribacter algarum]|uniref:FAD:protein FMN transferase n=2 Tax=Maribacter algarum (ex Zhang et al. 2020) TaxID=2578118 RepID=A0A5S3PPE1_9FLAO|nr:FAD:protein FMN transferase [Maribacter algarum]
MDWLKYSCHSGAGGNLLILLIVFLLGSCTPEELKIYKNQNVGGALGTSYSVIYLASEELDYQKEIDSVFAVVNKSMSTYIPDSDISKINRGDSTVVVDEMFQEVFELSKEIYKKTNGYFDPTVGTLVNAWGFGPGKQISLDSTRVDSLMQFVGFDKVRLTPEKTISKKNLNIHFDFNAVAKGYAIDRLAILMNKKGILNYLIEVGGEVVAKGENIASKRAWGIAVQDPEVESSKISIHLKDRAMASSGNYRKFRVDSITGKKYVHTINPKTGFTKNGNTLAVNILANTCAEADAYATAFMAMDLVDSIKFLTNQRTIDAYVIYLDEKGETQEFMTTGFKKVIME